MRKAFFSIRIVKQDKEVNVLIKKKRRNSFDQITFSILSNAFSAKMNDLIPQ